MSKKNHLFFLSYSRRDAKGPNDTDDPYFKRFLSEITSRVAKLAGISAHVPDKDITFYDKDSLQPGLDWDDGLIEALQGCKVLVCLYSRAYFKSDYCGKEFAFFRRRLERDGRQRPNIFGVLWDLPELYAKFRPAALKEMQDWIRSGEVYKRRGALHLLRQNKDAEFNQLIDDLAMNIVEEHDADYTIAALPKPPRLSEIHSAFIDMPSERPVAPSAHGENELRGPKFPWFFYVAGLKKDYGDLRAQATCYGSSAALWQPYNPHDAEVIHYIASMAASKNGLVPTEHRVAEDIADQLDFAEKGNSAVVIFVDPWSIKLPGLARTLSRVDRTRLSNFAVIVLWNDNDEQTRSERHELERLLRETFSHSTGPDAVHYPSVRSRSELYSSVSAALEALTRRIEERGRYLRGDAPVSEAMPALPTPSGSESGRKSE